MIGVSRLRARVFEPSRFGGILRRTIHVFPTFQIYGANTDVGKTVFSAGLCKTWADQNNNVLYVKPVQTGFDMTDNQLVGDAEFVHRFCKGHENLTAKCLYSWRRAASPHLSAAEENRVVPDSVIQTSLLDVVSAYFKERGAESKSAVALVETAGGILSPSPTLSSQADLYRPMRYPVVLVADPKLGGISVTLTAYEALVMRGYDVACILTMDGEYKNQDALAHYLKASIVVNPHVRHSRTIPIFTFSELLPERTSGEQAVLNEWFEYNKPRFQEVIKTLDEQHKTRISELGGLAQRAKDVIWWPFTQHGLVKKVTTIDSAYGDDFTTFRDSEAHIKAELGAKLVDSCGSWWTQGLGHGNIDLARAAAYAAGRYGHVMFPENAHTLAVELAELAVKTIGKGWANRVFYSDNGSSANEIALKMAFRYRWKSVNGHSGEKAPPMGVIGIQDGYHGDTIGAMDAVSPSPYNLKEIWYEPKGAWMEPPTVSLRQGKYHIHLPSWLNAGSSVYDTKEEVLNVNNRTQSALYGVYSAYVGDFIKKEQTKRTVGATILEPIIHGAGGMIWIDPLFQRVIVEQSRRLDIPVIFDEIFVGCKRLGYMSTSEILGITPDIGCYGKLLTGGAVPMAVTLATEKIYESFNGSSRLDALLHGHSYTAHAVGCQTALTALNHYERMSEESFASWDEKFTVDLSCHPKVNRVLSLGTVLAVELVSSDKGYGSDRARSVVSALRTEGVFARPLGNVVYWMLSPVTKREQIKEYQAILMSIIQREEI